MKKYLIKSLILFALFIILFNPNKVLAEEFIVKSTIIIPPDWQQRLSPEKIVKYQEAVKVGLTEAQAIYRKLLNGKTFNFSPDVAVEYSITPIQEVEQAVQTGKESEIVKTMGKVLFPYNPYVLNIIWAIGTKSGDYRWGSDKVWLLQDDLIALSNSSDSDDHKWSSNTILTHELGHAFGLVNSGYAKAHPCTIDSPSECILDAPRPYAPAREWQSIMGYGTTYRNSKDLFFNNSIFNPEINKIYQNPFINPQGDPGPEPQASDKTNVSNNYPNFGDMVPRKIIAGQSFIIKGSGFQNITKADLYQIDSDKHLAGVSILQNTGKTIKVQVAEDAISSSNSESLWNIKLIEFTGSSYDIPAQIGIYGKNFNANIFSIKAFMTCGEGDNEKPLTGQHISLIETTNTTSTWIKFVTSEENPIDIVYELPVKPLDARYYIQADNATILVNNKEISVRPYFIDAAVRQNGDLSIKNQTAKFNYPKCPEEVSISPTPSDTPGITSLSPNPLPAGRLLSINGSGFGTQKGSIKLLGLMTGKEVSENDSSQPGHGVKIIDWSDTLIKVNLASFNYLNAREYRVVVHPLNSSTTLQSQELLTFPSVSTSPSPSPSPVPATPAPSQPVSPEPINQWFNNFESSPIPTPASAAPASTPSPAPSLTQVTISNYSDFRPDNAFSDKGSTTKIIDGAGQPQFIDWTLSTLVANMPVYIRESYSDQTVKDSSVNLSSEQSVLLGNNKITLTAKVIKTITKLKINNTEVNLWDLNQVIAVRLNGAEGQAQTFDIPVEITYSDGSNKFLVLTLFYRPPSQPAPSFMPAPSNEQSTPAPNPSSAASACLPGCCGGVCGDCPNGQSCSIANGACASGTSCNPNSTQPSPSENPVSAETPAPAAGPSCPNWQTEKNICVSFNSALVLQTDSCTNNKRLARDTVYDSTCNNTYGYITQTTGCKSYYSQCGGTTGLESYPSYHTVIVIPLCDESNNIKEYHNEDAGDLGDNGSCFSSSSGGGGRQTKM